MWTCKKNAFSLLDFKCVKEYNNFMFHALYPVCKAVSFSDIKQNEEVNSKVAETACCLMCAFPVLNPCKNMLQILKWSMPIISLDLHLNLGSTGINGLAGLSPSLSFKDKKTSVYGFLLGIYIRLFAVNKADSFCETKLPQQQS